jgi:hypothetical protein
MASTSKTTRDHDEIRKWAEARGAVPAEVKGTERGNEPGILRFEFPGAPNSNDEKLEQISWEDFFRKFDENELEFVYQEKTADGKRSNFNKFVYPESQKQAAGKSSKQASSGKKHAA